MRGTKEGRIKGGQHAAKTVRERFLKEYLENPNTCKNCGEKIFPRKNEKLSATKTKIFCNKTCSAKYNNKKFPKKIKKEKDFIEKGVFLKGITKGELFNKRINWQSARSSIQKMARRIFEESDKEKQCFICGYSNHYEVCHIKGVSSFSDDTLISEINLIDNLVALCPNHHWEFDNKIINI